MFVNFSNHPSKLWSTPQLEASQEYGDIVDVTFPLVDPLASNKDMDDLALEYCSKILELKPEAVMVQGEMTLCYRVIHLLKKQNIKVICACSQRVTSESIDENGNTVKKSVFEFVQYREY